MGVEENISFKDVKNILDEAIRVWAIENDREANLSLHGNTFSWQSRDELLNAVARGRRLIQTELVGADDASQANLVLVLKNGLPPFIRRMPAGGPFVSNADIEKIQKWIEDGAK